MAGNGEIDERARAADPVTGPSAGLTEVMDTYKKQKTTDQISEGEVNFHLHQTNIKRNSEEIDGDEKALTVDRKVIDTATSIMKSNEDLLAAIKEGKPLSKDSIALRKQSSESNKEDIDGDKEAIAFNKDDSQK